MIWRQLFNRVLMGTMYNRATNGVFDGIPVGIDVHDIQIRVLDIWAVYKL
jgi:hypothetical protein